jgi:hypothetical protein
MSTVNSLLERTKQSTYVLQFADDIKYAIFLKKERITFKKNVTLRTALLSIHKWKDVCKEHYYWQDKDHRLVFSFF